ncbi:hypothetical protein GCM10009526_00360 [Glutamicibacter creatinolyticus]
MAAEFAVCGVRARACWFMLSPCFSGGVMTGFRAESTGIRIIPDVSRVTILTIAAHPVQAN